LILTDPPYHSTKKENIYGDADFGHDDEYREWIRKYTVEFRRVLKPNGSVYLFCSSDMAPYLYVDMASLMNMLGLITWTKPNEPGYDGWKQKMQKTSLRRWYPHTERIIFCAPALDGNLKRSPLGIFLKACREKAGMSSKQLTGIIGAYGRVNNGGAVSNWETGRNIPNRDQYERMCKAFQDTGEIIFMPAYEDVIRAFQVDASVPFIDVWDFKTVRQYKGKHPAEKPMELLHHIIQTSSYEGDIVLDCFAGSGSTLLSAISCNRRTIGIEIENKWAEYSARRLMKHYSEGGFAIPKMHHKSNGKDVLPLFSV
jgi:site-specific DNA-methyltransferase (adenine-specific)